MRLPILFSILLLAACSTKQAKYKTNPSLKKHNINWEITQHGDTNIYSGEITLSNASPLLIMSARHNGINAKIGNQTTLSKPKDLIKSNDFFKQPAIGIYSQWEKNQTWIKEVKQGTHSLQIYVWGKNINTPIVATNEGNGATISGFEDDVFKRASNLPVVYINTNDSVIPDEPKVPATLYSVKPNQYLIQKNDTINIALERRGNTSQAFAKKAYAIKSKNKLSLLGLPSSKKYVLYAPYVDKSLLRNALIYNLAKQTNTSSVDFEFCELVVNDDYQGIYLLMNRMDDLNSLNIDTNSYLIKIDRGNENCVIINAPYTYPKKQKFWFEVLSPKNAPSDTISAIIQSLNALKKSLDNYDLSSTEFESHMDLKSFVDYFILNEWSKNIDAYRLSTYLHYNQTTQKWYAGPIWDYNFAFGLAKHQNGYSPEGFIYDKFNEIPFWWEKLAFNSTFQKAVKTRWKELRETSLSDQNVTKTLRGLLEDNTAIDRNFTRWKLLGQEEVTPNYFIGDTHTDEINYVLDWIKQRNNWLDNNWFKKEQEIMAEINQNIAKIKTNPDWLKAVSKKAKTNQTTVEKQMLRDAWWKAYN